MFLQLLSYFNLLVLMKRSSVGLFSISLPIIMLEFNFIFNRNEAPIIVKIHKGLKA